MATVARPLTCRNRDNVPKSDYFVFRQGMIFTPVGVCKAFILQSLNRDQMRQPPRPAQLQLFLWWKMQSF